MNKWKVAFFVVLALMLVSNGYLLAQLIDSWVGYSYCVDSYNDEARRFDALGKLVVAGSGDYTQADILHLLRQTKPDAFIVEEGSMIHFEGISFEFTDDRLETVE